MSRSASIAILCCLFCPIATNAQTRTFEIDFVDRQGAINHEISVKVAAASYVDVEGDDGRFCLGVPCVIVTTANTGATGIYIEGTQVSTEDPLGKTVRIDASQEGVEVFYNGESKAKGAIAWGEDQVRFWFRVRSGGTVCEDGIGIFDDYRVDGSLQDDFSGMDGALPDQDKWMESNTSTDDGSITIQANQLRIRSHRFIPGAPEAVRWLKHTQAYELPAAIPTVSEWGVVVMTLLLLSAGTLVFRARRTATG